MTTRDLTVNDRGSVYIEREDGETFRAVEEYDGRWTLMHNDRKVPGSSHSVTYAFQYATRDEAIAAAAKHNDR